MNKKKPILRHILLKFQNIQDNEKICKKPPEREKKIQFIYKDSRIGMADISEATYKLKDHAAVPTKFHGKVLLHSVVCCTPSQTIVLSLRTEFQTTSL